MDQVKRAVDIFGYQVVQATRLQGSRWWIHTFETEELRPLIVRYVGHSPDQTQYFFEGRDGKAWVVKGRSEIGLTNFKPMLVKGGLV